MKEAKGMVYIFEGDGKGKTSAALGVAVRMLLIRKQVVWISWFKSIKWPISEAGLDVVFKKRLKMYWAGEGFYIKEEKSKMLAGGATARDYSTPQNHQKAAQKALSLAFRLLRQKSPPDLLVLDELVQAVNEKLLNVREVLSVIRARKKTHLVLTGHRCPPSLRSAADLVTEMKKIKHPYDKGVLAVRGLDY